MASDHRTSLRGLARRLGCAHSALSKAIDVGRLTAGIAVGPRGEALVVDADAAEAQWRLIHVDVPRIDGRRRVAPAAAAPAGDPLDSELYDRRNDRWVTGRELLEELQASNLVATAAVAVLLDSTSVAEIRELVGAALRDVGPEVHGADAADIARAERELEGVIMLADDDGAPP